MLDWLIKFVGPQRVVHEFFKMIEGKAYNQIAEGFATYADIVDTDHPNARRIFDRERLELRREIRQRADRAGPEGPSREVWHRLEAKGLDYKTAYGKGPVVFVFVSGEEVPESLWEMMIRKRK